MTELLKPTTTSLLTRRNVLQAAAVGAVGISPALRAVAYAQGSDAPEKKEVKIGFIPLTDCASVVMASVLGIDKKYGVTIIPTKEASWAGVRDKLVSGELDSSPGRGHPFPSPTGWGYTQHGPYSAIYDHNQRSVYLMTQRIKRHPFLALFDGALIVASALGEVSESVRR